MTGLREETGELSLQAESSGTEMLFLFVCVFQEVGLDQKKSSKEKTTGHIKQKFQHTEFLKTDLRTHAGIFSNFAWNETIFQCMTISALQLLNPWTLTFSINKLQSQKQKRSSTLLHNVSHTVCCSASAFLALHWGYITPDWVKSSNTRPHFFFKSLQYRTAWRNPRCFEHHFYNDSLYFSMV